MNTFVNRPRNAIQLPANRRGMSVFAMAGETDIAALSRAFEGHNATVQAALASTDKKIGDIVAEIDKLSTKSAAFQVVGGGGGGGKKKRLRDELKAVANFFRTKDNSELLKIHNSGVAALNINAQMSENSDGDGGFFVLPAFSSTMTKKLFDVTAMRRLSRVETITAGDRWEEPIDFGETSSGWVGETQGRPTTATPKIGKLTIPVDEAYCQPPVTQRLLDDVGFDLGGWLNEKATSKFGRDEGLAFLSGDGINKPRGLLSYPIAPDPDAVRPWGTIQYIPTGFSGGFLTTGTPPAGADCLRALTWKLRTPYRAGASWLMNSNTISQIDQLKDGQGHYIFRPSMTAGAPSSLLGYPVEIDDVAMPDIAANACAIAFGNFKLTYLIIDKIGIKLLIDPFTNKPLVNYYFYRRVGGGMANSEAVKLLRFSVS
ncbi:phage major capsid protein [Bradyrhizobium lablabi]|uniref:phage major capsid protein n=1 Tax=Bradyrhizobium lablabi TaxID=722472 RepID=UPI00090C9B4D|nr:phage major capsid protein [Bradyrhizobium lablabi]SHM37276.1 phage major capsid protein, HK97 family [Bradyrhizobium lablabi]